VDGRRRTEKMKGGKEDKEGKMKTNKKMKGCRENI